MNGRDEQVAIFRAEAIRSYWAKRGYDVTVGVEYVVGNHATDARTDRFDGHWKIVTDLVNGMPRRRLRSKAA